MTTEPIIPEPSDQPEPIDVDETVPPTEPPALDPEVIPGDNETLRIPDGEPTGAEPVQERIS